VKQIYAGAEVLAKYDVIDNDPNVCKRYFYLHDRLGSIRQVVDVSGSVKNTYTYQPFGENFAVECSEAVGNSFKFTGQLFDNEINQYYLRARQYDPQMMRFTTRDPVKGKFIEPMTLHAYLYCGNDSLNRVDLNGKVALVIGGSISFNSKELVR